METNIFYLSVDDVIEIHTELTGITNGAVRRDGLESAVAIPQATMFGCDLYPERLTKAAALLRSLAKNHPFVDGNKRVAWGAMRVFLLINGIEITASVEEATAFMLYVVGPYATQDLIVDFLYGHMTSCDGEVIVPPADIGHEGYGKLS